MYNPGHFTESDSDEIGRILEDHPLATLVASAPGGLVANHLPLVRREALLFGHVALANPLHADIADGSAVLAIFQGGDAYISPNWYPTKTVTHRVVPTWNYQVVHVHGRIKWLHEPAAKRRIVSMLTNRHEQTLNGPEAWKMADAPADYLAEMIDKIVAFEIAIERIEAKSKLNQNHPAENRIAVSNTLAQLGETELAHVMGRSLPE